MAVSGNDPREFASIMPVSPFMHSLHMKGILSQEIPSHHYAKANPSQQSLILRRVNTAIILDTASTRISTFAGLTVHISEAHNQPDEETKSR